MDIKDYLHYYLGCDVQYPDTDGRLMIAKFTGFSRADGVETTFKKKPKKGEAIGDYLAWKDNGYHKSNALNLKPFLRPLSDMTKAEVIELDRCGSEVHYLLSKGFDLFGLIDAGLAIDKTKL